MKQEPRPDCAPFGSSQRAARNRNVRSSRMELSLTLTPANGCCREDRVTITKGTSHGRVVANKLNTLMSSSNKFHVVVRLLFLLPHTPAHVQVAQQRAKNSESPRRPCISAWTRVMVGVNRHCVSARTRTMAGENRHMRPNIENLSSSASIPPCIDTGSGRRRTTLQNVVRRHRAHARDDRGPANVLVCKTRGRTVVSRGTRATGYSLQKQKKRNNP